MKKLYTTILTVALALTATASELTVSSEFARLRSDDNLPAVAKISKAEISGIKRVNKPVAKAPAAVNDILGNYTWTGYALIQDAEDANGTVVIAEANDSIFVGFPVASLSSSLVGVVAEYDAATGVLTFPTSQFLGSVELKSGSADVYFEPGTLVVEDNKVKDVGINDITAEYKDGKFVFEELDCIAFSAYQGGKLVGYFELQYANEFAVIEPFDVYEGFHEAGTAKLQDGWVLTCFGEDPAANEYEVALWQSDDNDKVFRLINPYKGDNVPAVITEANECTTDGCIEVDITDAAAVRFGIVPSGFYCSDVNDGEMCCYNALSWAYYYGGFKSWEETAAFCKENSLPLSTYADGVIDVTADGDACFGETGSIDSLLGGYSWQTSAGESVPMPAKITLNLTNGEGGVDNIAADNENAPVEYFNLQGVKIENPAAGGLYIKRQGSKVAKVIIK